MPYFGFRVFLEHDETDSLGIMRGSFVGRYKSYFNHLPINESDEKQLFDYFIINPLKETGEKKEDRLWRLASILADDNHSNFVDRLRVIEDIHEEEYESAIESEIPNLRL